MIKLGLDVAVGLLASGALLIIFGIWLKHSHGAKRIDTADDDARDMFQCPYCRHICVNEQHKKLIVCPVCKSYFDEGSQ